MPRYHRLLCPVDLSENSFAAIELATTVAKANNCKITFLYVSPLWLADEVYMSAPHVLDTMDVDLERLKKLKPTDDSIEFEHLIENGNAGPEVVKLSKHSDFVVMSTHGYGALMRLLMGGVAHYVLRNAKCPVVLFGNRKEAEVKTPGGKINNYYVTERMISISPIHEEDDMDSVLTKLQRARETAAPVVDAGGKCIGILTQTDIDQYLKLIERFEAKDETVLPEMFEVDPYGQRRKGNVDFHRVRRHMSRPAITVFNNETLDNAGEAFKADPSIHHLVVVDEDEHPVGILCQNDCQTRSDFDISIVPASSKE